MNNFLEPFLLSISLVMLSNSLGLAQPKLVSPRAQISLITGAPGSDLHTLFGHSAIRVYDPATGLNILYNYGTFDFETPGFIRKFVQKRLMYFLSKSDYSRFLAYYQYYNRRVYEQVLDLTVEEKQEVVAFLENNYLPKNRFYLYDFYFDNCSSRIRDVLKKVLEERVQFDYVESRPRKSFRDLIDPYLSEPWVKLGIYLLLGATNDYKARADQYIFLPDHLMDAFDKAKLVNAGNKKPLVAQKISASGSMVSEPAYPLFNPYTLFWSIFGMMGLISWLGLRWGRHFYLIDAFLYFILGLVGVLFIFLWFGTDHSQLSWNYNL
ncbi:MAG: DUF4105 domain-containing protein, partial [Bacteroidota bacterium]